MSTDIEALRLFAQDTAMVNDIREQINREARSTRLTLERIENAITTLSGVVTSLDDQVHLLTRRPVEADSCLSIPPAIRQPPVTSNPFTGLTIQSIVCHSVDQSGNLRQFSWDLYSILGRSVLGEELWNPVYLTTFKRMHEVVDMLERLTTDMFPLAACAGYWGARLLMVRAWNKIRANDDNQEGEQVPQQHPDTHVTQKEFVASEEESVRNSERHGDQSDTTLPYNPGSWLEEDKVNQESQDILLGVELTNHNPRSNHISGGRGGALRSRGSSSGGRGRVAAKSNMVRSGRVGRPHGRRGATFR
ncbi:hypothetical protein INT45_002747 [Circinella minor]|uniref:Uncharacterized protein n=1 Tax=Circinella minor TaxID=1195481 RepID=A0A8H7VP07_9FUNG|nr:hypothetical protein INT45_002747 [Circinella minor]